MGGGQKIGRRQQMGGRQKTIDPRQARGRAGEEIARRYLQRRLYAIIQINYRSRYGEIDIIACRDGKVAFVEVKARRDKKFGEPFEAVGPRKQRQLRRLAEMWLAEHQRQLQDQNLTFRFDVISMVLDKNNRPTEFKHIKNAF